MCKFLKRIYTAGACQSSADLKFTKASHSSLDVLFGKWKMENGKSWIMHRVLPDAAKILATRNVQQNIKRKIARGNSINSTKRNSACVIKQYLI